MWWCIVLLVCFNVIMVDRVLILSFNFMNMYYIYVISSSFSSLEPLPSPLLLKSMASFPLIIIAAHSESFINRDVTHFKHLS